MKLALGKKTFGLMLLGVVFLGGCTATHAPRNQTCDPVRTYRLIGETMFEVMEYPCRWVDGKYVPGAF